MMLFAHLGRHRSLYFTQCVEPLDYGIEYCLQMYEVTKMFHIPLRAVFLTYFNYSFAVKRFYQLTIDRLSGEITILPIS